MGADMFEKATQLAPQWEKPFFCYARYLDQLYRDARARQTKQVSISPASLLAAVFAGHSAQGGPSRFGLPQTASVDAMECAPWRRDALAPSTRLLLDVAH